MPEVYCASSLCSYVARPPLRGEHRLEPEAFATSKVTALLHNKDRTGALVNHLC